MPHNVRTTAPLAPRRRSRTWRTLAVAAATAAVVVSGCGPDEQAATTDRSLAVSSTQPVPTSSTTTASTTTTPTTIPPTSTAVSMPVGATPTIPATTAPANVSGTPAAATPTTTAASAPAAPASTAATAPAGGGGGTDLAAFSGRWVMPCEPYLDVQSRGGSRAKHEIATVGANALRLTVIGFDHGTRDCSDPGWETIRGTFALAVVRTTTVDGVTALVVRDTSDGTMGLLGLDRSGALRVAGLEGPDVPTAFDPFLVGRRE